MEPQSACDGRCTLVASNSTLKLPSKSGSLCQNVLLCNGPTEHDHQHWQYVGECSGRRKTYIAGAAQFEQAPLQLELSAQPRACCRKDHNDRESQSSGHVQAWTGWQQPRQAGGQLSWSPASSVVQMTLFCAQHFPALVSRGQSCCCEPCPTLCDCPAESILQS